MLPFVVFSVITSTTVSVTILFAIGFSVIFSDLLDVEAEIIADKESANAVGCVDFSKLQIAAKFSAMSSAVANSLFLLKLINKN